MMAAISNYTVYMFVMPVQVIVDTHADFTQSPTTDVY